MADIQADNVPPLTLKIAAFLTMLADGHVAVPAHVQKEARELVNALGDQLAETP